MKQRKYKYIKIKECDNRRVIITKLMRELDNAQLPN